MLANGDGEDIELQERGGGAGVNVLRGEEAEASKRSELKADEMLKPGIMARALRPPPPGPKL